MRGTHAAGGFNAAIASLLTVKTMCAIVNRIKWLKYYNDYRLPYFITECIHRKITFGLTFIFCMAFSVWKTAESNVGHSEQVFNKG